MNKLSHELADKLYGQMTIEQLEDLINSNRTKLINCDNDVERQSRNELVAELERIIDTKKNRQ